MRQIAALGGGGFSMEQENSLLVLDKKPEEKRTEYEVSIRMHDA
ncbi:hypothetical protein [Parageobacillus thermoglucosidasius]|nr:hypothetical protein [Parageobacillus thermoglucosidasius]